MDNDDVRNESVEDINNKSRIKDELTTDRLENSDSRFILPVMLLRLSVLLLLFLRLVFVVISRLAEV